MASLDKLAIRGVRSFDDKSINIIQFFSPLTVIVGYNGSGKTTIIECLKYATTGDLPPNTKGGAFVHDPQMATTNEVKAQVRLRFYSAGRVRMNCVRNLQVSKKKTGGLTMKTLEGLLQIADEDARTGKRGTISSRCSELDEEIPRLLGVSKSILENVIFCHQEESNWPLSEPASLKKKFDDIFEATRYTKALDNIKSLRKDRGNQLKVDKAALEGLKTDKDRADMIKTKMARLQSELAEKETRLEDLNEEIRVKTVQNSKFYDEATKFREIVNRAETLEEKERLHRDNMAALEATMTVIHESDADLQRRKDSFATHLDSKRTRADEHRRQIAEKQDELEMLEQDHGRKLSEKGGLEAEKRSHEQAIRKRQETVKRLSSEVNIRGFNLDALDSAQIQEFQQRLNEEERRLDGEYMALRNANSKRDDELTTTWQNLRSELRAKQNAREHLADVIKRTKDRIKRCQDELEAVQVTEADVAAANKDRDDLAARIASNQKEFEAAQFDESIRKKNNEIREKDDLREERTSAMNLLNRNAEVRATLGMKTQEITNRRSSAQALLDRHASSYSKCVGGTPQMSTFESQVSKALAAQEAELAKAEVVDQDKTRGLQQIESALTFSRNQLREKRDTVATLEREIKDVLKSEYETAEEAVRESNDQIARAKDEYASFDSLDSIFKRVLREAKSKGHCLACNRAVSNAELAALEKHVTSTLSKMNAEALKQEANEDIEDWTARNAECQVALAKETQVRSMQKEEIPTLEKRVLEAEEKLKSANAASESSAAAVDKLRSEVREIQNLKRAASDVTRMLAEATELEKEVEMLQNDLSSTGSVQTGDELQEEIDNLAASIKMLKRELNMLQQDREAKRSVLANLERELHRAEMQVVTRKQEYAQKETLEKRLEELNSEQEERQKELRALDSEIESSNVPIRRAKDELEQFKADSSAEEAKIKAKVDALQGAMATLTDLNGAVDAYVTQQGAHRLKECEEAIADLVLQMQSVQREVKEVESKVAELEREMNESKATERNLSDNLRYRQLQRDVAAIEEEINSLDLEQAQRSRKHFADKYSAAKEEENKLNGDASHLSGEIASLKAQIKGRETELREEYRGVQERYKRKLIEVKTSDLANNDLDKYGQALDTAIMRYHSIKMEEINDILRYLWQKTYQGTDIDTILIKSDQEGARGKRSYNYRVCMVKDTVEMDMRGRCSAGQKVLASIMIRLALAESFGSNCGILALDEPTTNLDKENIEALARALAELIKERRETSSLQLIVITHDEDFLNLLGQNDVLEYYWRVSRDVNQKSVIERERIRSV